ncbi:MAG: hypothetical protein ABR976_04290 [Terracidiphilus sp.]|jgi:hypothetical protein
MFLVVVCDLLVIAAQTGAQQHLLTAASGFPKACFFFKPGSFEGDKSDLEEEHAYNASGSRFYRLWCTASSATPQQKSDAANAMVVAWKRLWDRDDPFNAAFHEGGEFDLLALLGVTHDMPEPMRKDPKFTGRWIEGCSYVCFHLTADLNSSGGGRYTLMQLWLRNDVLDNLKKEPAAEPVITMLADAKFTLVD